MIKKASFIMLGLLSLIFVNAYGFLLTTPTAPLLTATTLNSPNNYCFWWSLLFDDTPGGDWPLAETELIDVGAKG